MSRAKTIPDDVLNVLTRSTLDSSGLLLPEQLDRAQYTKVAKVLEALGWKWNRKAGRHTATDGNGLVKISAALESGKFTDEKKAFDFFQTPEYVADDMAQLLGENPRRVLEPSAGHGRLVLAVLRRHPAAKVHAYELNPECIPILDVLGCDRVEQIDFMNVVYPPSEKFDAVIMNPPFSNGQDVEHVVHAMKFLRSGGRLVAIVSPAYTFREGEKWAAFNDLLAENKVVVEKDLPAGTFKAEGTNVRTVLICIQKK